MDRRARDNRERAEANDRTRIGNLLRLLVSDETGEFLAECDGGFGYEDYLININTQSVENHRPHAIYYDTDAGWAEDDARECVGEELIADLEPSFTDTDRAGLISSILEEHSEYAEWSDDQNTLISLSLEDFVDRFIPREVAGCAADALERLRETKRKDQELRQAAD